MWGSRGIDTTHKDSVTEVNTWSEGVLLISCWELICPRVWCYQHAGEVSWEGRLHQIRHINFTFSSALYGFSIFPSVSQYENPSALLSLSSCSPILSFAFPLLAFTYLLKNPKNKMACLSGLHYYITAMLAHFPWGINQLRQCLVAARLGHDRKQLRPTKDSFWRAQNDPKPCKIKRTF